MFVHESEEHTLPDGKRVKAGGRREWEVCVFGGEGRDKSERQRVVRERGAGGMDECTAQRVSVCACEREREREMVKRYRGTVEVIISQSVAQMCVLASQSVTLPHSGLRAKNQERYGEGGPQERVPSPEVCLSGLRLTSCQYLHLECSQGGHCCSNSQQPSPWQRALLQCFPQQLWSRSMEEGGGGVGKVRAAAWGPLSNKLASRSERL